MNIKILHLTYLVIATVICFGSLASANSVSQQPQPSATEAEKNKARNPQTGKSPIIIPIPKRDEFGKELGAREVVLHKQALPAYQDYISRNRKAKKNGVRVTLVGFGK